MADYMMAGATTGIEVMVDLPRERLWDAFTDLVRMAGRSPECYFAAWLDDTTGPHVGSRFEGHNRFANGFEWTVTGMVTVAERPTHFGWVVVDESGDPMRPGSIWSVELLPGASPEQTFVRQRFALGPGNSGFRTMMVQNPDRHAEILAYRLGELRRNMQTTLDKLIANLFEETIAR